MGRWRLGLNLTYSTHLHDVVMGTNRMRAEVP